MQPLIFNLNGVMVHARNTKMKAMSYGLLAISSLLLLGCDDDDSKE